MNQAELQQDLQRIASLFQSSVSQSSLDLADHPDPEIRDTALQQALLYQSAILDIATGPVPEVNLLDMAVFAELGADTLQSYWIPRLWGESGSTFVEAFSKLNAEVWSILKRVLNPDQQQHLCLLTEHWQQQNPEQLRVEGVRLLSFGQVAGQAANKRADEVHGLLGGVKSATQAADQALLLAERAMFLFQRLPFLLRAHLRVGAREAIGDTKLALRDTASLLQESAELRPLISEASSLLLHAEQATQEARALSQDLRPLLDGANELIDNGRLDEALSTGDRLSERTLLILRELQGMGQSTRSTLPEIGQYIDVLVRRWILYLGLTGGACSVLFWGSYFVVRWFGARQRSG